MGFDIMPSWYDSPYGYFWGYGHNQGADAPQRFGNKPFFTWDWGDTEIRYTWKTLTVGIGTQTIWLGPAWLNPILHSNNAPSYPKFDIGLRKQRVVIPNLDWYIGDVEFRLWTGYLTESDYFDNNPDNNHTMIHGLSFAYAPSFLPGLTLSADRTCLVPWKPKYLLSIIPINKNDFEDQKASFGLSYFFSKVGFEIYGELGIDDYVAGGMPGYIRYPFATTTFTFGLKKNLVISSSKNIYGQINFEFNWFETPQYLQFHNWYAFYFHHQLIHGYTNRGQWLGSGIGTGGNNQYLNFMLYYPKGNSTILIGRNNPDLGFMYKDAVNDSARNPDGKLGREHHNNFWANFLFGLSTAYFPTPSIKFSGGIVYNLIINQYYQRGDLDLTSADLFKHNINLNFAVKYSF
jgi:hypothetical protein